MIAPTKTLLLFGEDGAKATDSTAGSDQRYFDLVRQYHWIAGALVSADVDGDELFDPIDQACVMLKCDD